MNNDRGKSSTAHVLLARLATLSLLALAGTTGCGGSALGDIEARVHRAERDQEGDLSVQAARQRVLAARTAFAGGSPVPSAQLRLRDLSARGVRTGTNGGGALRLELSSPWSLSLDHRLARDEQERALNELEEVALERQVALCEESVATAQSLEQRTIYEQFAQLASELLAWNEQWRQAGTLEAVEASRTQLWLLRRLQQTRPDRPPPDRRHQAFPLPPLARPPGSLRRDPDTVARLVTQTHPEVARREAEARLLALEARREASEMIPWLDWVQLEKTRLGSPPRPSPSLADYATS